MSSLPWLGACSGVQSTLDPAGPSAQAIAQVWWWMLAVSVLVTLGVVGLWVLAMWRGQRRRRGEASGMPGQPGALPASGPTHTGAPDTDRADRRWLIGGGIALPTVAILALLVFGTPAGRHQLPFQRAGAGVEPLRVEVMAQQWSWTLHYPGSGVQLQDELRMPVGRPVDLHISSRDVIHSFWVPRLGGKLDAVPGRTNVLRLQADQPGVFRGQCAEFCGRDHAHMLMVVHAMPASEFDAWLAAQPRGQSSAPVTPPSNQQGSSQNTGERP
jgi:cytochrome c oxidase subunit II